jgi:hypothetical protein
MTDRFRLHLPNGAEYGPVDMPTLVAWRREGRIVEGSLIWPEGSPDWLPASAVLPEETVAALQRAPGAASPVAAGRPVASDRPAAPKGPGARAAPTRQATSATPNRPAASSNPSPAALNRPAAATDPADVPARATPRPASRPRPRPRPAPGASRLPRALLLTAVGVLLVAALVGALFVGLSPWIAERRAQRDIERYALPERHFSDSALGLTVDLPPGWILLRPDNPLIPPPDARLELAEPKLGALATLRVESEARLVAAPDVVLDRVAENGRLFRSGFQTIRRGDLRLGKGVGRVLYASWEDGSERRRGATVVFYDAWNYYTLEAACGAARADAFTSGLEALARGILPSGKLESAVAEATMRVGLESPELSRAAVRLLVQERMSGGQPTDDLPATSLQLVSRGLSALASAERAELGQLYAQVWGPLPEVDRRRLARYLDDVKAGRPVAAEDAQPLRQLIKEGVLALTEESRARLQSLNEKAVRAGLSSP